MSDNEKAAQIGHAVLLLEARKRDLAHLEAKIDRVRLAYRTFASERERWSVDPANPARVYLRHPAQEERDLAASLLSEPDLAALIAEHKLAVEALAHARATLAGFGIDA
jgi:hypothetical protein